MPRLMIADPGQVREVYRHSHALWGAGLSFEQYLGLWLDLEATPWASAHASFLVRTDDSGEVLSSLKLYRPRLTIHGVSRRAVVLGAIFTPPLHRREGHASAAVGEALGRERDAGTEVALLFSDIGPRFYSRFGFRELPALEHWGRLRTTGGRGPAPRSRPVTAADMPAIVSAHDDFCRRRSIAVLRDAAHWEFLRVRSNRFFERLADGRLAPRFDVLEDDRRFVGYVVAVEGRGEWTVREVGAPGGTPADLAGVLRAFAPIARSRGARRVYGWLPPDVVDELADWKLVARPRRRAVPMLLSLVPGIDVEALREPASGYLPFQDQF